MPERLPPLPVADETKHHELTYSQEVQVETLRHNTGRADVLGRSAGTGWR